MLVLTRKEGERILIGENISVTVVRITGGSVRLGVEAPPQVSIMRSEIQADRDGSGHTADERSVDSAARRRE